MQLRSAVNVVTVATLAAAAVSLLGACARHVEVTSGGTTGSATAPGTASGTTASTTSSGSTGGTASGMRGGMMTMTAQLTRQGGSTVTGTGTVTHGDDPNQFRATAAIFGAAPNATHPWHVHEGRCGDNGPVVGPASAYTPLQADTHGAATQTATIPVPMPSGPLYVNVHQSPQNMGTIVSCGNLAM